MNEQEKLHLQKLIINNNVEDQTDLIRKLKHSELLRNDINTMILYKAKYRDDPDNLHIQCMNECQFLFTYYTDIYNKIRKDEIDLPMLFLFLDVLKDVEDGNLDQHEASFKIGSLLKKIYVDSALKKSNKYEEQQQTITKSKGKNVSWKEYKKTPGGLPPV